MRINKISLGIYVFIFALAASLSMNAKACSDEYMMQPQTPNIEHKLPHKLSWSAERPLDDKANTHLWLFKQAKKILAKENRGEYKELLEMLQTYYKEVAQGIFDADHKNPYYDCSTFVSHFYNPTKDNTYLPGFKNAKQTGAKYFKQALQDYKEEKLNTAFYKLGLSIHYFTDISQPMHANNFTAVSNPIGFHSVYEGYVDSIKCSYQATESMEVRKFFADTPEEWLRENAKRAKADYDKIVNANTKKSYLEGNSKWKKDIDKPTGERLQDSMQTLAGFIDFWYKKANQ
ncbi:phospholipase C [Listeria ivanovii]|uniref:Phospholipase C n=2 Tax=Listeria ivanovii TaxID=1638 RepID=Q6R6C7_LISIV|nr:phospholipase C [Listeria ivanovii]EFR98368.1 phospholipase C [Listeria ivanovii FSL F6-596]AAR97355.1 PlcB [Listeria ivanovii subsp. londoniensis]AIS58670.1 phospholipase C [Listeria ivanovii subsp. londoniensis]AIS61476.1 phospholipase C [Listeria ivanovii subsp. londoniensis]MBK1962841.1 zinc dependent phospholipase C family protein [Listeria ivanovii subsp. londoniensis]